MLEKPEGAIKNGQYREIDNNWHAKRRTRTHKNHTLTTQKIKKTSNKDSI